MVEVLRWDKKLKIKHLDVIYYLGRNTEVVFKPGFTSVKYYYEIILFRLVYSLYSALI